MTALDPASVPDTGGLAALAGLEMAAGHNDGPPLPSGYYISAATANWWPGVTSIARVV